ncbi:MAG: rhomboid family intramembrane serine protease [Bacteroidetes bacterium]|nr:MAG: rhomboid family intramembrane serine protease [Bacteroidota bacterium]TAG87651.1 MAG: rhomboid family intramembrane serine protease [Bacteroidota bacterium]
MENPITLGLILISAMMSYLAEEKPYYKSKWLVSPYLIKHRKEYYRIITGGFIHQGYLHLLINMYVLFIFGKYLELKFADLFGFELGIFLYAVLYLFGIVFANLLSLYKYQDSPHYAALGASGAVSAIVFSMIMFNPLQGIGIIFIPVFIPGFIFAVLYLLYSTFMANRGQDNVDHGAHFMGAIFGFLFTVAVYPPIWHEFLTKIFAWFNQF